MNNYQKKINKFRRFIANRNLNQDYFEISSLCLGLISLLWMSFIVMSAFTQIILEILL